MHVAIVENTPITHHGQVGVALHEAGARISVFAPRSDGRLPRPEDFDALVVFGGEQAATDDHLHPWLPDLAARMRACVEAGKPVLGICLGAQLLARGFGAENRLGVAREFGWCEVARRPAAAEDPVLGAVAARFPIFQWHADSFDLPEGAVLLAESPVAAHQAFRIGRAGYGMQFHFEASRAVVADWSRLFPDWMAALEPDWPARHTSDAATLGPAADAAGLALARAWVGLV